MWLYPFGTSIVSQNDDKLEHYAKIGVEHLERAQQNSSAWKYGRAIDIMYVLYRIENNY